YSRFELRVLLRQLDEQATAGAAPAEAVQHADNAVAYETVFTEEALEGWLQRIDNADVTAINIETTSIEYMAAELVGIALSVRAGEAAYIPLAHSYAGAPEQLALDYVLKRLKGFFENPGRLKVGHHLKYDAHVLAHYGIALQGMAFDAMLESYVYNSVATRHELDAEARFYLGVDVTRFEDVAGKGAKQVRFDEVETAPATRYAAERADVALQLHEHLWSRLGETGSLMALYRE